MARAVQINRENPYRLARDIRGTGFLTTGKGGEARPREEGDDPGEGRVNYALAGAMDEEHCPAALRPF